MTEGEEDIVVPEGMNVFVGYGDGDVKNQKHYSKWKYYILGCRK